MRKLVFDIGGTNTRLALYNGQELELMEKHQTASPREFLRLAHSLCNNIVITSIAGAVAGEVKNNKLLFAPNLDHTWQQFDFYTYLSDISPKIYVLNDVEAGAIAEATKGAGRKFDRFGYIAIGTGFGGALFDRATQTGIARNDFGFEPGHLLSIDHQMTNEQKYSGQGWENFFGKAPFHITDATVWQKASFDLAQDLRQIAIAWSVKNVIIGGSMVLGKPAYDLDVINEVLLKSMQGYDFKPAIQVAKASIGDSVNLWGAALL